MLRLRQAQAVACRYASSSATPAESVIELREYTLHPSGVKPFLDLSAEHAAMRARLNPGFRGCASTATLPSRACSALRPLSRRALRAASSCATPAGCSTASRTSIPSPAWRRGRIYASRSRPTRSGRATSTKRARSWHTRRVLRLRVTFAAAQTDAPSLAQESMIMLEASDCHAAAGVPPASQFKARRLCSHAACAAPRE